MTPRSRIAVLGLLLLLGAGLGLPAGRAADAQREREVVRKLDALARERTPAAPPAAAKP